MTEETLAQLQADELILATGCQPLIPAIPGLNENRIKTANGILGGKDIISGKSTGDWRRAGRM